MPKEEEPLKAGPPEDEAEDDDPEDEAEVDDPEKKETVEGSEDQTPEYKPWPEGIPYVPGQNGAPALNRSAKFGEPVGVGDFPRIGKRVNVGMDRTLRHPLTGRTGLKNATTDMNTGRGCDLQGKLYKPPPRFCYLKIHRFSEEADDYEVKKSYEVDFGPSLDSEEFKEGLRTWKASKDFGVYEKEQKKLQPDWEWKDPIEDKTWERCRPVEPEPLSSESWKGTAAEEHASFVRKWANQTHPQWIHPCAAWREPPELLDVKVKASAPFSDSASVIPSEADSASAE